MQKHWSKVEYLHETVKNPNIVLLKAQKAITATHILRTLKIMSYVICTATNTVWKISNRCGITTNFISEITFASVLKPSS